jgi:hypothetical protein
LGERLKATDATSLSHHIIFSGDQITMKDRRKLERYILKIPADITVETTDQMRRVLHLRTRDISSGGAFFSGANPLPEGTVVKMALTLSADRLKRLMGAQAHVKIRGIVKRSEPSGMAICFNKDYHMMSIKDERNNRKGTVVRLDLFQERRPL